MGKKRIVFSSVTNRGQITIFMILGMVILFIFFFLFQVKYKVIQSSLARSEEDVLSKLFRKEALRLYVESCLSNELEQGLILIGRQGRLWDDQGGSITFSEGQTGVTYNGERIYYALRTEDTPAYPCNSPNNPPQYCQYLFPDTSLGFGEITSLKNDIENDLKKYLKQKAITCVQDFVSRQVGNVQFSSTEVALDLSVKDEGIAVEAFYPLSFRAQDEDFFHLSQFDFFYPTEFKRFLKTAVTYPLEKDWIYADFSYTPETMVAGEFTYAKKESTDTTRCTFNSEKLYFDCTSILFKSDWDNLGIEMSAPERASQGDTIFNFQLPPHKIINSATEYTFRFARQNRPPALDYVNRSQCLSGAQPYDYVVIKGDDKYGSLNINLAAHDADEELLSNDHYSWEPPALSGFTSINNNLGGDLATITPDLYTLKAKVQDNYGAADEQEVRILVDRPIEEGTDFDVKITLPYKLKTAAGIAEYGPAIDDVYYISKEDPVFIDVKMPSDSLAATTTTPIRQITFTPHAGEGFMLDIPASTCVDLPSSSTLGCDLNNYNIDNFNPAESYSLTAGDIINYNKLTSGTGGNIKIDFSVNYCSNVDIVKTTNIDLVVKECLPTVNPNHPYPYVPGTDFYQYEYEVKADGTTDFGHFIRKDTSFNPFNAPHACCDNYNLKLAGVECFKSPVPNCQGKVEGFTTLPAAVDNPTNPVTKKGYVFEQTISTCDGARGNVCGGPDHQENGLLSIDSAKVLMCGDSSVDSSCSSAIASQCKGNLSWGYVDVPIAEIKNGINDGWCNGKMGCNNFCTGSTNEVVAEASSGINRGSTYTMNTRAQNSQFTANAALAVHCGCTTADADANLACDANWDGTFEGNCQSSGACN